MSIAVARWTDGYHIGLVMSLIDMPFIDVVKFNKRIRTTRIGALIPCLLAESNLNILWHPWAVVAFVLHA